MVFKIRVGRVRIFFPSFFFKPTSMLLPLKSHKLVCFFLTTAYKLFDMQYNVFGSKHRSNVQENEENSNRKPVFNKSVSIKRLSESVKSQQSSIYCWNQKQTRKRGRISRFCRSIFFFGIKRLGSVSRSIGNTHIFLGLRIKILNFYFFSKYILWTLKCRAVYHTCYKHCIIVMHRIEAFVPSHVQLHFVLSHVQLIYISLFLYL